MTVLVMYLVVVIISVVQHWRMMNAVYVVEKVLFMNVDVITSLTVTAIVWVISMMNAVNVVEVEYRKEIVTVLAI